MTASNTLTTRISPTPSYTTSVDLTRIARAGRSYSRLDYVSDNDGLERYYARLGYVAFGAKKFKGTTLHPVTLAEKKLTALTKQCLVNERRGRRTRTNPGAAGDPARSTVLSGR